MSDGITDANRATPLDVEIAYYERLMKEAEAARDRNLKWYYSSILKKLKETDHEPEIS